MGAKRNLLLHTCGGGGSLGTPQLRGVLPLLLHQPQCFLSHVPPLQPASGTSILFFLEFPNFSSPPTILPLVAPLPVSGLHPTAVLKSLALEAASPRLLWGIWHW